MNKLKIQQQRDEDSKPHGVCTCVCVDSSKHDVACTALFCIGESGVFCSNIDSAMHELSHDQEPTKDVYTTTDIGRSGMEWNIDGMEWRGVHVVRLEC